MLDVVGSVQDGGDRPPDGPVQVHRVSQRALRRDRQGKRRGGARGQGRQLRICGELQRAGNLRQEALTLWRTIHTVSYRDRTTIHNLYLMCIVYLTYCILIRFS